MNARKPQSYVPPPSSSSSASSTTSSSDQPDNNDRAPTAVKTKTKIKTSKQSPQQKASAVAQRIVAEAQLPPAVVEDATDERKMVTFQGVSGTTPTPIITLPPPPPAYLDEVPPLAVYHICRICFRPRSSAYHRSHPIPVNAVPPPPGICRRCRILKVEETTTRAAKTDREVREIEIVRQSQSNDIRLGLFTGINDEDYISREKWEAKRARALLREAERQRLEDEAEESENERDVTYRHVRVRQRVDCPTQRLSIQLHRMQLIRQRPVAYVPRATGASGQRDGLVSSQKEATSSRAVKVSTSVTRDCSSNSSHSQSTVKAKAKVETTVPKPAPTESEIRKIAREEIVRYRQAERKLQAHPDPYAHGRMVPVERRIDTKASNNDDVPWRKDTLRVQIGRTGATDQQATERPARKVQEVPVANQKAPVPKRDARVKLRNKSPWSKARSKQDEAANEREIIVERVHHRSEATKKDRRDEHVDGRDPSLAARAASHAQSTATEPRSTTSERTKWARTGHEADLDSGTSSSSSSHRKHSPQIAEWYQESTSMRAKSPLSSGPRRSNVIEVETELELPSGAKTQAAASYSRAGRKLNVRLILDQQQVSGRVSRQTGTIGK
ncbi:hypothetical protein KC329_g85 [Hortaea werneckii]|nr:hypothetical protein KC329_g85 [Hortaea werneckii]